MADAAKLLKSPRVKNLFNDIVAAKRRKMPCGDERVAIQLRAAGLIRFTGERQDVTTAWSVTEIGNLYVD